MLNQTELRRKKLLEQMRTLYSDDRSIPAIHPRYKMMHQQLYNNEYEMKTGTFGIRTVMCIFIFFLYIVMEYRGTTLLGIDNMQVLESIMQNIL